MPYYAPLKKEAKADRDRTIDGLNRLRNQLLALNFPTKKTSQSIILGTWNLRNFDDDRFNYGQRTTESLYYLAEILSRFDVIAVQEICEDVYPLNKLLRILGSEYEYILTDVTHYSLGGNQERLGFIFDRNKVRFTGIAGEIVLPKHLTISDETKDGRQFARTPFGVEFRSGWFQFNFSTVHIYFGSNRGNTPQYKRRVAEINAVANYIATNAKRNDINQILVGDFNIKERGSEGFNALEDNGFTVVQNRKGSNRDQTKYYDQISFISRKNELEFLEPERDDRVIQFFNTVYRDEDFASYRPVMHKMIAYKLEIARQQLAESTTKRDKKKYTRQIETLIDISKSEESERDYYDTWRTFQMSDHLPLWVEIKIDFSKQYLDYLKAME